MLKISWDAGHAGFGVTSGKRALDNSMYEWDFNDGVVDYAMEALSHYENVEQLRVDDPSGKVDVSLAERANRVNVWGSNLHISVHGNAATPAANGIETFVHPSAGTRNREVALTIHNHIIHATNRRNRGLKEADFQILRSTKMDALLIEGGFMTNAEELALMKTNDYRARVGRAIVAGIVEAYRLKRKEERIVQTVANNELRYIYTGGYAGKALMNVHEFLMRGGHGFDTKRGSDGSIIFLIGPFYTGMQNYKEVKAFVNKWDKYNRLLTPEQAAVWRN